MVMHNNVLVNHIRENGLLGRTFALVERGVGCVRFLRLVSRSQVARLSVGEVLAENGNLLRTIGRDGLIFQCPEKTLGIGTLAISHGVNITLVLQAVVGRHEQGEI